MGEAERGGNQTPTRIAQFGVAAKGIDASDKKLAAKGLFSVKDVRKRMARRDV